VNWSEMPEWSKVGKRWKVKEGLPEPEWPAWLGQGWPGKM